MSTTRRTTKPKPAADTRTLSDQLRDAIRADGRSQAEIARAAEVTPANLCDWLAGNSDLRGVAIDRIARVLGGSLVFSEKNGTKKVSRKSAKSG